MEDGCKSGYLEIENGVIRQYYPDNSVLTADADYGDNRIIPGIFDTHNHGGFGISIGKDTAEDDIKLYLKGLASTGVTAVFPTTAELDSMNLISKMADEIQDGAKIMGIHSEGPWGARVGEKGINTGYPKVDLEYAAKMVEACNGKLMLVGIAPEVEGSYQAIDYFLSKGVHTAVYHTDANYEQANHAIDRGITVATHLGNVMTGLHHRDIGVMGACIMRDEVWCELICDFLHICPEMIEIILKLKDNDKIMIISDNVTYAGAPAGTYRTVFGHNKSDRSTIHVTEDGFVLSNTGRLSGSSKPVIFGIKNLVEKLGIPLEKAIRMSSYNPCKKYGFADKKGSLAIGKDADFAVISDNFDVLYTYSEGRLVYDYKVDTVIFNQKFVDEYKLDKLD
jgi:N-acetylglucosamine-6-phosphate deacetylase